MADKDLQYGQRVISGILKRLDKSQDLAHSYAEAVLAQAVRNAASKPTPQARMAAENMTVTGADIHPTAGGAPAAVAIGSEFGSARYLQFHRPPNPRGYWLYPAATSIAALAAGDEAIEDVMQRVIRGF